MAWYSTRQESSGADFMDVVHPYLALSLIKLILAPWMGCSHSSHTQLLVQWLEAAWHLSKAAKQVTVTDFLHVNWWVSLMSYRIKRHSLLIYRLCSCKGSIWTLAFLLLYLTEIIEPWLMLRLVFQYHNVLEIILWITPSNVFSWLIFRAASFHPLFSPGSETHW